MEWTLGASLGTPIMIDVPGARLASWSRGHGPAALLVHGGTGTASHDWGHLIPALAEFGRIVAVDLRGHGESIDNDFDLGVVRFGLDLPHVMKAHGIPRAVMIGFSVGANSVLSLLSRRPWLAHAAIIVGASTRGKYERAMEITKGPWPRELRSLVHGGSGGDPSHWERIRDALAHDWAENVHFTETGLSSVTCPVTIMHGANDPIVLPEQSRLLDAILPQSTLIEVPATGHQVHREAPDVFLKVVTEVLDSVRAAHAVRPYRTTTRNR